MIMDKTGDGKSLMSDKQLVGQRIRELRTKSGLSLRALAELSGLSTNAISLIERGDNSPTVSSLHSLATALTVPITAFFDQHPEGQVIHLKKSGRPTSETAGVKMENLGSGLPNQQLEPFLMTIEPGGSSTSSQITHSGEELVYVLQGALVSRINDKEYPLEEGDSLLFLASQPHIYRNETRKVARILIIFAPMVGQLMAHRHYLD
jgi:quercetin dioxygenase-like cupin family protein/DNA-binding transcriptional regulator YiaG